MAKLLEINFRFMFMFMFMFITITYFPVISCSSSSQPSHHSLTSCLIYHHVTNFSFYQQHQPIFFFSLQNLRFSDPKLLEAAIIIIPETKQQLVSSLICSKNASYEVRTRCGGHSYEGLSSIISNNTYGVPFVIIDLMKLEQVVVDLGSKTAWVDGGATLGQVYSTIAEKSGGSFGFSAGSCPTVGVGGLISGGGFGFLSRKYGLAADNVVDVLLVDPNGQILDRVSMGEDVFWAVRGGGGGSFGIVYAWKIKLLNVPPKVTSFKVLREGKVDDLSHLVHKWQYVGPYLNDTFYVSTSIGAQYKENSTSVFAIFNGLYLGLKFEAISIMDKLFPELGLRVEECKETSWIESVLYFSDLKEGSTVNDLKNRYFEDKNYFKAKSDYVKIPIPLEGVRGAIKILSEESKGSIIMDPYGGEMGQIASDSIPFPHRKGNLFSIQYIVSWEHEDDKNREQYLAWIRKFYDFMAPFVSSNPREAYVNYLDLDLGGMEVVDPRDEDVVEKARIWGEKYFLKNFERLVRAKTTIDPCNFFHYPQGIPPLPFGSKHCHNYEL